MAPRRFPGPGAALLARPWEAWEAGRRKERGRRESWRGAGRRHVRQDVATGVERNRGGGILGGQWTAEMEEMIEGEDVLSVIMIY